MNRSINHLGGNTIYKKSTFVVSVFIVILLSGCGMNEKLEEMNNSEPLIVIQSILGEPGAKVRNYVFDDAMTKKVNEVFAQVDWQEDDIAWIQKVDEVSAQAGWDWRDDAGADRPLSEYQIGNYEIWLIDQFVHAINIEDDKYAKLTAKDSEFIIKFIIGVFH